MAKNLRSRRDDVWKGSSTRHMPHLANEEIRTQTFNRRRHEHDKVQKALAEAVSFESNKIVAIYNISSILE